MNNLGELNDILFDQLRKLSVSDSKNVDGLKNEINKTKAITDLASSITENAKVVLAVEKFKDNQMIAFNDVPQLLDGKELD